MTIVLDRYDLFCGDCGLILYIKQVIFSTKNYTYPEISLSLLRKTKVNMNDICAIKDVYKVLYQFEKDFAEANELTINEAMLLCCLKEGEAKSAGTICEFIGLSNSRVSKVITGMEDKGYIRRKVSREDKRQMFFSLTPKGKEKIEKMKHADLKFDSLYSELRRLAERD